MLLVGISDQLQWGRALARAETNERVANSTVRTRFNGAARSRARKRRMGNTYMRSRGRFNGAARSRARKQTETIPKDAVMHCFNGAARSRARKRAVPSRSLRNR